MILPSNLITLDYNPSTDVLFVVWPDINNYSLDEIKETLQEVVRNIRYYDVKRLLIDSRRTVIRINKETYNAITAAFGKELLTTRLKKIARLESGLTAREVQARELSVSNTTAIALETFPDRKTAIEWLLR